MYELWKLDKWNNSNKWLNFGFFNITTCKIKNVKCITFYEIFIFIKNKIFSFLAGFYFQSNLLFQSTIFHWIQKKFSGREMTFIGEFWKTSSPKNLILQFCSNSNSFNSEQKEKAFFWISTTLEGITILVNAV